MLPAFRACSPAELRAIAGSSTLVTRDGGTVLTREGVLSREFAVLASGSAVVTRDGRAEAMLRPGDSFGDADLLSGRPSSATVIALTDSDLVVMSRREFLAVLETAPAFRRRVIASLADRAR
jgi:CRP-like cAMP-binding protein